MSLVKSILFSSKKEKRASRKATLFENTPRNFIMEKFLYFYYFSSILQYDSIFLLHQSERVPSFSFIFLCPYRFFAVKSAGTRGTVTFLTRVTFLRISYTLGFRNGMRHPFPVIRAKFQVSFRKVPADAYALGFTRVDVRATIED